MPNTQYALFRDLDRHCVAVSMNAADCREAARRKRAIIDSPLNRDNPLVREVMAGRTTFTAIYDDFSRGFRGVRRFLPKPHSEEYNERLECFGKIVPNVRHFTRRSVWAMDNPATCALYGIIVSAAIAMIWAHALGNDADRAGGAEAVDRATILAFAFGCGSVGFLAGLLAMLKYRTRSSEMIHAREAAAYMDLNYNCHRTLDDEAWAKLVALKTTPALPSTGALKNPGTQKGERTATATT